MVERYPHKLVYQTASTGDWYDEDAGTWMPGQPGVEAIVNCRARPAGAGKKKPSKDGTLTEYAYDLAFEYDENFNVPQNAQIEVIGVNEQVMYSGELGGYQIGNASIIGWI